jgi:hypothetical protein
MDRICLGTSGGWDSALEDLARAAVETGVRGLDVRASTLEAYLARYPTVVLDTYLHERGLYLAALGGLCPLPGEKLPLLSWQARFLDLCTHLDALGGALVTVCTTAQTPAGVTARALRALSDLAAPFEVRVAHECGADGQGYEAVVRAARGNVGWALDLGALGHGDTFEVPDTHTLWLVRLGDPLEARTSILREAHARLADAGYCGLYSIQSATDRDSLQETAKLTASLNLTTS